MFEIKMARLERLEIANNIGRNFKQIDMNIRIKMFTDQTSNWKTILSINQNYKEL